MQLQDTYCEFLSAEFVNDGSVEKGPCLSWFFGTCSDESAQNGRKFWIEYANKGH